LGSDADLIITSLRSALDANDRRGVERLVVQALRGAGADIVSEASNPDLGADIAVWSDALQPFIGNPLLIEVKSRIGTDEIRRAADQLFTAVASSGGSWGLLLYGRGSEELSPSPRGLPPTILTSPIEELIQQLRTRSFAEVVRDLRNQRVHGGER
jgi:hypothetical protein